MSTASLNTSQGHAASSSRLWLAIMQNVIQIHMLLDKIVSLGCLSHWNCFCFELCFTPSAFLSWLTGKAIIVKTNTLPKHQTKKGHFFHMLAENLEKKKKKSTIIKSLPKLGEYINILIIWFHRCSSVQIGGRSHRPQTKQTCLSGDIMAVCDSGLIYCDIQTVISSWYLFSSVETGSAEGYRLWPKGYKCKGHTYTVPLWLLHCCSPKP